MSSVKLSCCVCLAVNKLTYFDDDEEDNFVTLPLISLVSCGHNLCLNCVVKIKQGRILKCPMCRKLNNKMRMFSVNENTVTCVESVMANVKSVIRSVNSINYVDFAKNYFKTSMSDYKNEMIDEKKQIETNKIVIEQQLNLIKNNMAALNTIKDNIKIATEEQVKLKETTCALKQKVHDLTDQIDQLTAKVVKTNTCDRFNNNINSKCNTLKRKIADADMAILNIKKKKQQLITDCNKMKEINELYVRVCKRLNET
ncbi:zinc finger protein [Orgyia leucostigma nucleopolyhedrovirus]|uniref:Zinc finger protein n=1 Tax=Orgyia leucostigma nucleopolyhedrovirus TaxID=490711 RepID=B0FDU4_9ABAC|nr:zinc finger protein [Orgyia leucostigma nucleopolyhedrovirus]ABY65802.1 zinc finger protein [Orgyia leucostigma nucleopolyhedrovirus]